MSVKKQYAYPAIFDIQPDAFTVRFPDLPIEPVQFDKSQIAESFDIMANILGHYISECMIFDTALPKPTDLKALKLTPDEKGVMITVTEA